MSTPDERPATAGPLRRRPEVRQWAHHVADLNIGEVHTSVLGEPPTSRSRIEGLSRLGSLGGTTIFNGPTFVLTSKIPYVASPESWVTALIDYFNPFVGMQWTSPPSPQNPRNLTCYFSQLPAERSLLTIFGGGLGRVGPGGGARLGGVGPRPPGRATLRRGPLPDPGRRHRVHAGLHL
jgi:hypothetical protein